jgi:hypothetical protein
MNANRYLFFVIGLLLCSPLLARELSQGSAPSAPQGTELYLSNAAHRDETKGDYASAIVIYDELIKRYPHNTHYPKALMRCEKASELAAGGATNENAVAERLNPSQDADAPLPEISGTPELGAKPVRPDSQKD